MNWLTSMFGSSIGKKLMMAVTGLSFCGFLVAHLAGNLSITGGKDMFNAYALHLHSLGLFLTAAEWVLLTLAVIHVLTGITLFYGNLRARPIRYRVNRSAGRRTIGSATMPYTGLVLLAFVIFHLLNFHFVDKTQTTIYQIVSSTFQNPLYVSLYIAAMIVAALHVSHGFWSAFQTIGANHPKYMPFIRLLSVLLAMLFGVGFGFLPIFISITA